MEPVGREARRRAAESRPDQRRYARLRRPHLTSCFSPQSSSDRAPSHMVACRAEREPSACPRRHPYPARMRSARTIEGDPPARCCPHMAAGVCAWGSGMSGNRAGAVRLPRSLVRLPMASVHGAPWRAWLPSYRQVLVPWRAGSERAVTLVERAGPRVAAIVHDPAVLDDPKLVRAVASQPVLLMRTGGGAQIRPYDADQYLRRRARTNKLRRLARTDATSAHAVRSRGSSDASFIKQE